MSLTKSFNNSFLLQPRIFPKTIFAGITKASFKGYILDFNLNNKKSKKSYNFLFENTPLSKERLQLLTLQNHKDEIHYLNSTTTDPLIGDALITNNSNLGIGVKVADCGNILIYDPISKFKSAVHCGYKGAQYKILTKTLLKLKSLGAKIENLLVWIGPMISKEALLVWKSTAESFEKEFSFSFEELTNNQPNNSVTIKNLKRYQSFPLYEKPGYLLDLKGVLIQELLSSGVSCKNLEVSKKCTFSNLEFHSFRREVDRGGEKKLMLSFIL